jgi:tRNA(fMet)-specific endonuclease VapC
VTRTSGLVLLDTSLLLHLLKATAVGVRAESEHSLRSRSERPLISIVTVGEALAFARKRGWGSSRVTKLHEQIQQLVIVDINSSDVLDHYAEFDATCEAQGKTLGKNDLWIAATAAATGALLLTTDKDSDPLHHLGLLRRAWYEPALSP